MAAAPDPKAFGSWEDAFQYPIAAVRGMERQLRNDIDSNRERLRSLVGASYRDLLGTADTIIKMDGEMQKVEVHLADMGAKCNTRLLEKKAFNLKRWETAIGVVGNERYTFASQLAVLRGCPAAISRLLKNSSSVLLAAKALVISRLLHTKLSQRPNPPPYLETLRDRLAALRRRLLTAVDKRMMTVDLPRDALIDTMCAFCLATSSSPTDILRHFHHVRMEAMTEKSREGSDKHDGILRALRLYIGTLKDTKALFPGLLTQALEDLKLQPLFKSQDLYALLELNLDLHERWIEDDIKSFTPYIRLNDLHKFDSERFLRQWAGRALSSLLNDLRETLDRCVDTFQVMQLRKQILELWFSNQHHSTGIEPAEVVDGLRDAINTRWTKIIQSQVMSLGEVGSKIRTTILDWPVGNSVTAHSLWKSPVMSMEVSYGAKALREALIARSHGTNETLQAVSDQYTQWLQSIEAISATIKAVQAIKWDDALASIEEDDDILNDKQILLSEDDPNLLREAYSSSIQEAFGKLQSTLQTIIEGLNEVNDLEKATFLLRNWRDIRQRMPDSYINHDLGLDSIATLQSLVAKMVVRDPVQRNKKRLAKAASGDRVAGRPLWQGDPPLPVLPSPWMFSLLREVMSSMTAIGSEVWSTHATDALKLKLRSLIAMIVEDLKAGASGPNGHRAADVGSSEGMSGQSESGSASNPVEQSASNSNVPSAHSVQTNGDVQEAAVESPPSDISIQQIYDLHYLSNATAVKHRNEAPDTLAALQSRQEDELGISPDLNGRMKKSADEYWKRTTLLFGLLA